MESFPDSKDDILSVAHSLQKDQEQEPANADLEQAESTIDRIWLGFNSGDQEAFEYDNQAQTLFLMESEKSKEHEAPLTGLDYNRKLGLLVSSCEGGSIRIWSPDKKFLREIAFPHKVDSVCFFNASGDILVSHEQRVSVIAYERYNTESFNYVTKN